MRRSILFILPFVLLAQYTSVQYTCAQSNDLDNIFSWSISKTEITTSQGNSGQIELTLTVADEHIVYRNMTSVSAEGPEGFSAGEPLYAKTKKKIDPLDNIEKEIYAGANTFKIPFTISSDAPMGAMDIKVTVRYQGCSKELCYFPTTREFPVAIQVTQGDVSNAVAVQEITSPPSEASSIRAASSEDFFSRGFFLTFLFVYVMGLLTSLTPCVYPLIPITVTIFGARKTRSSFHAFSLAATYVLGIVMMYSALGYFAAVTGAVFGQFLSNPWIVGVIALFFTAMGISMLGAFELQLPSSLQSGLTKVGGEGYLSAFLMGLVAGVVAAPCTGPVLAGILAYVATTGNPLMGIALLQVYSLGLGTLFLVIGTYSGMLSHLPKSGGWMDGVKSVFAIILFVCALYFLKNAFTILQPDITRSTILIVVCIITFIIGASIGAMHLSFHSPSMMVRFRKILGILLCVIAIYLPIVSQTKIGQGQVDWVYNLEEGLALAQEQDKPVIIDFWAEWCTLCKEIDHYTFHDETVADKLNQSFISIKVDLTVDNSEEAKKITKLYGLVGLPLLVFYDSQGNIMDDKRINAFIKPEEFLAHIKDIP
jgi:thioredoxin:protein disulfide reductase